MAASLRGMGAPDAVIDRERQAWLAQQPEQPHLEIFPENVPAFQVLMATADQWEEPGSFGGRLALPLSDIQACLDLLGMKTTERFLQVMVMVRAAREAKLERLIKAAEARKHER